ncbi:MAG: glycosyltransferase [Acidimicrobiia bacterium]
MTALRSVVLAGGGTAGHVMPALAIAEALVAAGRPRELVGFVGSQRGMESTLIPAAGYRFDALPLRNFSRQRSLTAIVGNVRAAGAQLAALAGSWKLVGRRSTAAVVSVGGYASVPPVLAAWIKRVPVLAVSYDAHAGLASRLAGRIAVANAVAFAPPALPRARVTGAPVRPSLLAVDRVNGRGAARAALDIAPGRFFVFVVGGSLGSGTLNTATEEFVAANAARTDLAVRQVVGERNLATAPPSRSGIDDNGMPNGIVHQVIGFESHMDVALTAADVVIARAGASTVAELAALAVPSVLIAWPDAAADHQRANARWLANAGAAIAIEDAEWNGARMTRVVDGLRSSPTDLDAMASAARSLDARHGAERIAELIEEHAR